MNPTLRTLPFLLLATAANGDDSLQAFGQLSVGASNTDSPASWREDGLGRWLDDGLRAQGHFGLSWQPDLAFETFVHARADSDAGSGAQALGLVEGWVAYNRFHDSGSRWRLQAGQFFLPTSREAIDPLWQSRYHLSLSALNSWIAEEFRPIGLDLSWRNAPDSPREIGLGATLFGGNDSAGALLAWRGFASHDRLSVLGEVLALPPLPTIANEFAGQRDDGTKPFGPDLDDRPGYSLRGRFGMRDQWRLLGTWTDTRGDRDLHRGEYAWATRFAQFGFEWWPTPDWTFAAEHMIGHTGMGLPTDARVDARFVTQYVLLSRTIAMDWRISGRLERFRITDQDGVAEDNADAGNGATITVSWQPAEAWRLGFEVQVLDTDHAASPLLGLPTETGGTAVRAELRYAF